MRARTNRVKELLPQPSSVGFLVSRGVWASPYGVAAREAAAFALAIACDIHPINNLRVLNYLKGPLRQDQAALGGVGPRRLRADAAAGCDLAQMPRLVAVDATARALPAFADAAPEAQPDAA